jgi:hypothetical protein
LGFRQEMFDYFDKALSTPSVGRVTVNASQLFDLLILARKGAHAEGEEITAIPQHMRAKPGERHPQTDDEHNPQNDPTGGALARSVARLNYAADYADPRALDQMALVWRIDLIRLSGDWQHKRAFFEHVKDLRSPKITITEDNVTAALSEYHGERYGRDFDYVEAKLRAPMRAALEAAMRDHLQKTHED